MPPRQQPENVISMQSFVDKKYGATHIDAQREKAPKQRLTVRQRIGATVLAALMPVGAFLGAKEEEKRQALFEQKAIESETEQQNMTPQEAAEHGRQEAAELADQQAAYEEAQHPDEMTPGLESSLNGTESATVADGAVTNPEITDEPQIIANEDKPVQAVGHFAGEASHGNDS